MRAILSGFLGWGCFSVLAAAPLMPDQVAVVYNSAQPESADLARKYAALRQIPENNLIGLALPTAQDMSREDYNNKLLRPLREQFETRRFWRRASPNGFQMPAANKIRVLVTMRGVPLRISQAPKPAGWKPQPGNPLSGRDEAAVDSELTLAGVDGQPIEGLLDNKYFKSAKPINDADMPYLMLVSRIDAPSAATCERMMKDAVETEKTGLWGLAYVDIAEKGGGYAEGDQWLEGVIAANARVGIPTVIDRFHDTLPQNYPMGDDVALYYGWYATHVCGPFLLPGFKFRKGAIAMHLHSMSACQLINPNVNWSAPLLERGAACTIGNVYEPYLGATHHFDIMQERLLAGFTWVESAWAAMPAASWQAIVLGDPLYRPFLKLDGRGPKSPGDVPYIALRMAEIEWGKKTPVWSREVLGAATRMKSGPMAEALGLRMAAEGKNNDARVYFEMAKGYYEKTGDKFRQDFHKVAMLRATPDGKADAMKALRDMRQRYGNIPESAAIAGWLSVLDPPPPPPAAPAGK